MKEWAIGLICFLVISIAAITWFTNSEVYHLAVGTVERLNETQDKLNRTLDTVNDTLKTVQKSAAKLDRSTDNVVSMIKSSTTKVGATVSELQRSMGEAVGGIQKDIDRIDRIFRLGE